MYKVLFSFLKVLVLRLASNSFPFSSFFPFQKPPTSKKLSPSESQKQKSQSEGPDQKPGISFSKSLIPSSKQGGAVVPGEEHDTVTGETCVPASLNVNNLRKAVLHFPLPWRPGL
jgi:hypothetical protein